MRSAYKVFMSQSDLVICIKMNFKGIAGKA
jgi:hypothetical protein